MIESIIFFSDYNSLNKIMSKQKENRLIRTAKETAEDNCELSAEEKATKTLHYISLEGGD